ncbi:DUF5666 domain-containing protein [Marinobacter sp. VGCF2001]|uniref:DUF5666 domain-containing protein n=1 Tax=Marinobacter sp. VGCF2001 TaxID=3417189 RepID=UPI003CF4A174
MSRTIKLHTVLTLAAAPLVFGVLGACGGGGGGGVSVADGGIRGTGSSVGPVSGFGSVFVNGIEFFTDDIRNRSVTSNDGVNTESDLEKGMILRVEGVWDDDLTGTAQALNYDDTFRGPISAVEMDAETGVQTLTILGQTVVVDRRTVMRLGAYADLAALVGQPDNVRISAWHTGDGYRASFIGVLADLPDNWVEVEGKVSLVNGQLQVNGQSVQLSDNAQYFNDLEPDELVGEFVEFEGELNGESVLAQTVRLSDDRRRVLEVEDGEAEISGPLTAPDLVAKSFRVNGVQVQYSDATDFEDFSVDTLSNGVLIEVEGEFRNGILLAEDVELLEEDAEIEATVTSDNSDANTLIVGGVKVHINGRTLIDLEDSGVKSVYEAAALEIEGRERIDDQNQPFIEAVSIDATDADFSPGEDNFRVRGRLDERPSISAPNTLKVLGLVMDVSGVTFDDLTNCRFVEVEYVPTGAAQYRATSVECDD